MQRAPQSAQKILGLVQKLQKPLVGYTSRLTGDVESARDVVQEAFLRLCADKDLPEPRIRPWLYKVCRNLAIDHLRKNRKMIAIDGAAAQQAIVELKTGSDVVELKRDAETVLRVLATLSPNQQEVVRLRFAHGLSYKEISDITELSVSNVGYLIHVAVTAIRVRLEPPPPRAAVEKRETR
jgi:RNA polymerase sigma-70 factor (ECF subfamily)